VIYVSPFPLPPDVEHYYSKLLQVFGITLVLNVVLQKWFYNGHVIFILCQTSLQIRGNDKPDDRFKIVFPENYDRFPSHLSIASVTPKSQTLCPVP
jgi:hypothetical protein